MPTALSSTEAREPRRATGLKETYDGALRAVRDVRPLVAFRAAAVRGRARPVVLGSFGVIILLSVLAGTIPAYLPGAAGQGTAAFAESSEVLLLLPSAYFGVLVISIISAAASGGGRELLPRDQGVAYPVSPATDHLGALMMAPLNIAWLMQSWVVLAATSYVVGPKALAAAQVPVLLWLFVATALAQAVSWGAEWVRRGPAGAWVVRGSVVVLVGVTTALIVTDRLVPVLDKAPTLQVVLGALYPSGGQWGLWLRAVVGLLVVGAAAVVVGALLARAVAARPATEETRLETAVQAPRANPVSDLVALMRTDRAGIWRSVPLRRGLAVLGVLPGLVALAGGLDWSMVVILPGLVVSGGALLFGVNAWSLDGRGALWRDSLPVSPGLAFVSRVLVLSEVLLAATALTLTLAFLRAGVPTAGQLSAVLAVTVVVTLQVVNASMRWSVRRPYSVDLRSARATPAPPLVMVGYSTRLALSTTFTAMVFMVTGAVGWEWSVLVAVPFVLFSSARLAGAAHSWRTPEVRSRAVVTVAS